MITPRTATSRIRRSILNDIIVENGPSDVLGPFFLHVELKARRQGIALEFCSPAGLVAANESNSHCWLPLVPMFNPKYGLIKADNSFCVIGRNAENDPVTANAIIKYDWTRSDYIAEATSLRLFYADPFKMRQPGEQCIVTCPECQCISGHVAFSGAAWVRQDYRGRGLSELLPRFIKAFAVARWRLDFIFGMMAEAVQRRGFATQFGYDHIAWEANWLNSIVGTLRLAILWTDVAHLAEDLRAVLKRAPTQVDSGVFKRNTQ